MVMLKVTAAGASASSTATLTAEDMMMHLEVSQGDTLGVTKASEGAYRLTRCNDAAARQMSVAERIMREDREVLRKLA